MSGCPYCKPDHVEATATAEQLKDDGGPIGNMARCFTAQAAQHKQAIRELVAALESLNQFCINLADSGDVGNWAFQDTLQYSSSMQALAKAKALVEV